MTNIRVPLIKEVMTANPTTIDVGATAEQAADIMKQNGCRHLPVTESGKAIGILSYRDIALGQSILKTDPSQMFVRQVYVEFPYSADPDTPLDKVLTDMAELAIGSALIMEGNELEGIFTTIDAFKACAEILGSMQK